MSSLGTSAGAWALCRFPNSESPVGVYVYPGQYEEDDLLAVSIENALEKFHLYQWLRANFNVVRPGEALIVPRECVAFSVSPEEEEEQDTNIFDGRKPIFLVDGMKYDLVKFKNMERGQRLTWLCSDEGNGDQLVPVELHRTGRPRNPDGSSGEPWAIFGAGMFCTTAAICVSSGNDSVSGNTYAAPMSQLYPPARIQRMESTTAKMRFDKPVVKNMSTHFLYHDGEGNQFEEEERKVVIYGNCFAKESGTTKKITVADVSKGDQVVARPNEEVEVKGTVLATYEMKGIPFSGISVAVKFETPVKGKRLEIQHVWGDDKNCVWKCGRGRRVLIPLDQLINPVEAGEEVAIFQLIPKKGEKRKFKEEEDEKVFDIPNPAIPTASASIKQEVEEQVGQSESEDKHLRNIDDRIVKEEVAPVSRILAGNGAD